MFSLYVAGIPAIKLPKHDMHSLTGKCTKRKQKAHILNVTVFCQYYRAAGLLLMLFNDICSQIQDNRFCDLPVNNHHLCHCVIPNNTTDPISTVTVYQIVYHRGWSITWLGFCFLCRWSKAMWHNHTVWGDNYSNISYFYSNN